MVVKVTVILSSRKFNYTPFTYQKILVNFPQFEERKSNWVYERIFANLRQTLISLKEYIYIHALLILVRG